jgi:hypothetical protein
MGTQIKTGGSRNSVAFPITSTLIATTQRVNGDVNAMATCYYGLNAAPLSKSQVTVLGGRALKR